MNKNPLTDFCRNGYWLLGILAAVGLIGYGMTQIIVMPSVSPSAFVPTTLEPSPATSSSFALTQAGFVVLYALAFLPLIVMFTIKTYSINPYALILAGCLFCIALLIEILNGLPALAAQVYPVKLAAIPAETLLYLRQVESIRYLSYDVPGFSLAYAAACVYAIVFFRTQRWLSYLVIGSVVTFIANVPCLWLAPNAAVILMGTSILLFAAVPISLAKMVTSR